MLQSLLDAQARGRARIDSRAGIRLQAVGPSDGLSVRVVTYNIHTCVGVDRRYDPGRVAAVLREIDADIACLQEVDARRGTGRYADQWAYLGEVTERRVITGEGPGGDAALLRGFRPDDIAHEPARAVQPADA